APPSSPSSRCTRSSPPTGGGAGHTPGRLPAAPVEAWRPHRRARPPLGRSRHDIQPPPRSRHAKQRHHRLRGPAGLAADLIRRHRPGHRPDPPLRRGRCRSRRPPRRLDRRRARRARGGHGPLRGRQVHAHARAPRPPPPPRPHPEERRHPPPPPPPPPPAPPPPPPPPPLYRLPLPLLHPPPAALREGDHRPPAPDRRPQAGQAVDAGAGGHSGPRRPARPPPGPALRRPAAACGDRPRDGRPAERDVR